jgi:hypothetical protein
MRKDNCMVSQLVFNDTPVSLRNLPTLRMRKNVRQGQHKSYDKLWKKSGMTR